MGRIVDFIFGGAKSSIIYQQREVTWLESVLQGFQRPWCRERKKILKKIATK